VDFLKPIRSKAKTVAVREGEAEKVNLITVQ